MLKVGKIQKGKKKTRKNKQRKKTRKVRDKEKEQSKLFPIQLMRVHWATIFSQEYSYSMKL